MSTLPHTPLPSALPQTPLPNTNGSFTASTNASVPPDMAKHPSGIVPTVQNIVSTANLGTQLTLTDIVLKVHNAEYNPKRFAAVIMRIRDPKTTALVFSSGKVVCTGAKSESASKTAAKKYAKSIQHIGYDVKFKDFAIQNIVAKCDVKFVINIEKIFHDHSNFCSYEPEIFPGLIYKMLVPKVVLLVFVSGKVVLTGAKTRDQIYEAFEKIYPTLKQFEKKK